MRVIQVSLAKVSPLFKMLSYLEASASLSYPSPSPAHRGHKLPAAPQEQALSPQGKGEGRWPGQACPVLHYSDTVGQ